MHDTERRADIGRRLQEVRGDRDQRSFADAVDSVQQTISKYERGEIPRSWLFLARLAEEEQIDLTCFLTGRRTSDVVAEGSVERGHAGNGHGENGHGGNGHGGNGREGAPRARSGGRLSEEDFGKGGTSSHAASHS